VLWATVRALARRSDSRRKGAFYFDLSAMILCYAVVESYANFLLNVLDPAIYNNEFNYFRRRRGTQGKIAWALRRARLRADERRRPYTTLRSLRELRNLTMHAKPDTYRRVRLHSRERSVPMFELGRVERRVTRERRGRAIQDVEAFCEAVHAALLLTRLEGDERRRLEPFALRGSTHWQTTHTTLNVP
jgi:hypothetical protein